jgi:hypothetical protein
LASRGNEDGDLAGVATAGEAPVTVAHYLGVTAKWGRRHRGRRRLVYDPSALRRYIGGKDRGETAD